MSISNQPSKELAKNFEEDVGPFLQASLEHNLYKPILEKEKWGLLIDFFLKWWERMWLEKKSEKEEWKTLYDMLDDMEELELIGDLGVGLFDMLAQS